MFSSSVFLDLLVEMGDVEDGIGRVTHPDPVNGFALTEQEADLFDFDVEVETVTPSRLKTQWAIAATLHTSRKFHVDAMETTLVGVWKLFKGVSMRVVDDNLFIFEFNHERDMLKVLNGGSVAF